MPGIRYLLLFLACLAVFAAGANASILDGNLMYGSTQTFYNIDDDLDAIANIESNVLTYTTGHQYEGKYGYTYQITNTSDLDLKFLTMQIFSGVEIEDHGFEVSSGINPKYWGPAGSPTPYGFDAYFDEPISGDGISAILWFVSSQAPSENKGEGLLFGTYTDVNENPWTLVYAEGELFTPDPAPIPEPATFLLISMGTFAIIGRRKRSQEGV